MGSDAGAPEVGRGGRCPPEAGLPLGRGGTRSVVGGVSGKRAEARGGGGVEEEPSVPKDGARRFGMRGPMCRAEVARPASSPSDSPSRRAYAPAPEPAPLPPTVPEPDPRSPEPNTPPRTERAPAAPRAADAECVPEASDAEGPAPTGPVPAAGAPPPVGIERAPKTPPLPLSEPSAESGAASPPAPDPVSEPGSDEPLSPVPAVGGWGGRGGMGARRASVLMHPPFPRARVVSTHTGRCHRRPGPAWTRPSRAGIPAWTDRHPGADVRPGTERSSVRARHSTGCCRANGNQSVPPGHLPGTSPYPAVILSGRLRS